MLRRILKALSLSVLFTFVSALSFGFGIAGLMLDYPYAMVIAFTGVTGCALIIYGDLLFDEVIEPGLAAFNNSEPELEPLVIIKDFDTNECSEFVRGARAMFDYMQCRAANNWHGWEETNKLCEQENELVLEWAEDALYFIDPDSVRTWRTLSDMYREGHKAGLAQAQRERESK